MASLTSKKVDYAFPMSRDTFHPYYYARSMKVNLLDDGVGHTLVSPAFDDVTLISHGKRVNLGIRIEELNLEPSIGNGDVGERFCPFASTTAKVGRHPSICHPDRRRHGPWAHPRG
jgi:hypothetical protein